MRRQVYHGCQQQFHPVSALLRSMSQHLHQTKSDLENVSLERKIQKPIPDATYAPLTVLEPLSPTLIFVIAGGIITITARHFGMTGERVSCISCARRGNRFTEYCGQAELVAPALDGARSKLDKLQLRQKFLRLLNRLLARWLVTTRILMLQQIGG